MADGCACRGVVDEEKAPPASASASSPLPSLDSRVHSPPSMRARTRTLRLLANALIAFAVTLFLFFGVLGRGTAESLEAGANENVAARLGFTQLLPLPRKHVPTDSRGEERRLVFVGDVHGMFDELKDLLEHLSYTPAADHLVFTGDMVVKGPDSLKVIDFARSQAASCVRGNHEDRVMMNYHHLQKKDEPASEALLRYHESKDEERDEGTAKSRSKKGNTKQPSPAAVLAEKLSPEQAAWLDACPLILHADKVPGLGRIAVVHAGLVHGIELQNQDPTATMSMRTIDKKYRVHSHSMKGQHWASLWNKLEKHVKEPLTVIYGHFAAKGLDIRPLTKGLDSSCVRGGRLSALVASNKQKNAKVVSVPCRKNM